MPYNVISAANAEVITISGFGAPLSDEGMTLAELDAELNLALINRPDVNSTRRRLWLNLSYVDMVTSLEVDDLDENFQVDLVVGQPLYLLPSGVFSIKHASFMDAADERGGYPLEKADLKSYRARPVCDDDPIEFFRYKSILVVWPTPNRVMPLSVDVRIRPEFMTADNHSPILGVEWHESLLLNARKKMFQMLQEHEASLIANDQYVSTVRDKQDQKQLDDDGKESRSSVPRSSEMLRRRR